MEQQIINDLKIRALNVKGSHFLVGIRCILVMLKPYSFVQRVKECPDKDIWVWTGYKLDELDDYQRQMLPYIDVLIDGKFIQEQADPSLVWRGSANQSDFIVLRFNRIRLSYSAKPFL